MESKIFPRSAGILLHPTSLPGPFGVGDLGPEAFRFVDWLASAGIGLWQVLPLVPPGGGFSPYGTQSALSMSPWLVSPLWLLEDGLLDRADLDPPRFPLDAVDFGAMVACKTPLLRKAAERLLAGARPELLAELEAFRDEEPWVEEAALFAVLHAAEQRPWWEWDAGLRNRQAKVLKPTRSKLRPAIDLVVAEQWFAHRQWDALRAHCRARGVRLMGDIPIYVDRDSVDVWAHREGFLLDRKAQPSHVAGVPPDYFSKQGQLWGNPLYDWGRMRKDGFSWWVERLRRALAQVDLVRLDHFRGFSAYWAVPAGDEDATGGEWVEGPGEALFDALREALGELPLVAEDLGDIDEPVHALRRAVGLPGMKVLQFAFGLGPDHPFLPHQFEPHSVVYTGTHDNDTTLGWWRSCDGWVQDHVRRYLAVSGQDVVWDLIRLALASVSHTAVIPLQDALGLASDARMNQPGERRGNWAWRVRGEAFNDSVGGRLRYLVELFGRLPKRPPAPSPAGDPPATP